MGFTACAHRLGRAVWRGLGHGLHRSVRQRVLALLGLVLWACSGWSHAQVALLGSPTTALSSSATTSLTLPKPAVTGTDVLLLAALSIRGGSGVTVGTVPTGWTLVQRNNSGTNLAVLLYRKSAPDMAAEPASYQWGFTSGRVVGTVLAFSGADTTTPVVAAAGQTVTTGTNQTAPALTPNTTDTLLLTLHAVSHDNYTLSPASGMTELIESGTNAGPNGTSLMVASQALSASTSTGTRTATSSSAISGVGISVAIASGRTLLADFRFDENLWQGQTGEAVNSVLGAASGTAVNGAFTQPGKLCRAGTFNGVNQYLTVPGLSNWLSASSSLSFWIKTTQTGTNDFWLAPGVTGLDEAGPGPGNDIFWGWLTGGGSIALNKGDGWGALSTSPVNNGQWRHVALTRDHHSGLVKVYVDGQFESQHMSATGVVTNPFTDIGRIVRLYGGEAYFAGALDELKAYAGVLTAAEVQRIYTNESAGLNADGSPRTCPAAVTCVVDDFASGTLNPGLWNTAAVSGSFVPQVVDVGGQKRLRLTEAVGNQSTLAQIKKLYPGAGNKIVVEFDHHVYGGNGADGITVTFSDAAIPPSPGGFGGSLGYAQRSGINGFNGGWLGVALDEFGNFPSVGEGRIGYPTGWTPPSGAAVATGRRANNVSIRGSGSGTTGYALLANTGTLATPIWQSSNTSASRQRFRITIDHSDGVQALVSVERDTTGTGNAFSTLVAPFDVKSAPGQAAVPTNWLVSFTGSTGGSRNIHEVANLSICATYVSDPAGSSDAAAFDCLQTGTNLPWNTSARKPLYTQVTGTPFSLDVAALKADGTLETNYISAGGNAKVVQVALFDDSASPAPACSAYANPVATRVTTFVSGLFSGAPGRTVSGPFTLTQAYTKLRCQVRECTDATCSAYTAIPPACSSDTFSVRPTALSVTSNATASGFVRANADTLGVSATATPVLKAGAPFSLLVDANRTGYNGTPKVNPILIEWPTAPTGGRASPGTGTLAGVFNTPATAATGNGARGDAFTYSEVGYFRFRAGGVYDDTVATASGDVANGDCVSGSFSNTASGGRFGCNVANTAASSHFGRFIPDRFALSAASLTPRGNVCAAPTASTFHYLDEPLWATFTLTAQNSAGATTQNYTGAYARLVLGNTGTVSPNLVRLSGVASGNGQVFAQGTRLSQNSLSGSWSAGVAANARLWFTPQSAINPTTGAITPDGPFATTFGLAPQDPDGVTLAAGALDLDADSAAPGPDRQSIGSVALRFGQLRLENAYGSDRRDLEMPLAVRFWNGTHWQVNTDDNCTTIPSGAIAFGRYTGSLDATQTQLLSAQSALALSAGRGKLVLAKPATGLTGSFDVGINLANSGGALLGKWCGPAFVSGVGDAATGFVSITGPAGAMGMSYLANNQCSTDYSNDPVGRATFGIYKSPLIYRRENY